MTNDERGAVVERLMAEYGAGIKRLCALLLSDAALAEDASQEVFIKAWSTLDRFRGESSEKTWLTRIAVNTCRDYQRTGWFRRVIRGGSAQELPEQPFYADYPDSTVTSAILSLALPLRTAVLLRYYEDMTFREIASAMRVSVSTAHRLLNRAEKQLRNRLEGWYFDE